MCLICESSDLKKGDRSFPSSSGPLAVCLCASGIEREMARRPHNTLLLLVPLLLILITFSDVAEVTWLSTLLIIAGQDAHTGARRRRTRSRACSSA
ncbi:hypothetical protein RHGRI_030153 [Rhododendron griersonianum]|uniref:Uncharacterized protein n=1 Tax=Rhododendron griersonianum TaxID=479676 RepID=A0AAV6ILU1_9ERIC|nr:hypothetical protein RHGRI_030153 [Rhododendron griersonianum]